MTEFLPVNQNDMKKMGLSSLDFIFISGDAYVDHPSFGHAIVTRLIEAMGFSVGIIPQPDWHSTDAFKVLGKPNIAFLVSAGNIDSMVNHYTALKRVRNDDLYSPNGKAGYRPDRATIVYCNKLKEAYNDVPIIIGGIEGSLRRFAHYDYWDDRVRNSILKDSCGDLLVYGMGEKPLIEILNLIKYGKNVKDIKDIRGTCYMTKDISSLSNFIALPSLNEVKSDKNAYAKAFKIQYEEQDPVRGKTLSQEHDGMFLVQNPPPYPLTNEEMDFVYSLPYKRTYHPMYKKDNGIPALSEVEFSITSHRGCFGSCSFCALTFHQGRIIQSRSKESIVNEAIMLSKQKNFKGYIHDIGGPTANFTKPSCKDQLTRGTCKNKQCMFPKPCKNINADHKDYLDLLREVRNIPNIKKVFIRSGIRYDYLLSDTNREFFEDLVKHHISGQLKVAPEHVSDKVLKLMGKPSRKVYDTFVEEYFKINKKYNMKQFLVPYLMSSHPGSDLKCAIELAEYIRDMGYSPEQVQDFYPTPGSLSTAMYYTNINPLTNEKVYVPRDKREKEMQRALLQFKNPANYNLVYDALKLAKREDLIGFGEKCLIPPRRKGVENNKKHKWR